MSERTVEGSERLLERATHHSKMLEFALITMKIINGWIHSYELMNFIWEHETNERKTVVHTTRKGLTCSHIPQPGPGQSVERSILSSTTSSWSNATYSGHAQRQQDHIRSGCGLGQGGSWPVGHDPFSQGSHIWHPTCQAFAFRFMTVMQ